MTDREKVVVMAYTGVAMVQGDKLYLFYKYLAELFGRPVFSHEIGILADEIKERSKPEFLRICAGEDRRGECTTEKWVISEVRCPYCLEYFDTDCYDAGSLDKSPSCGNSVRYPEESDRRGEWIQDDDLSFDPVRPWWYCSHCGERTGIRTKYCSECGFRNLRAGE